MHDDLAAQLDDIAETIGDRALESLRAAVEAGETTRPREERELAKARRAVEKAATVLRALADERRG